MRFCSPPAGAPGSFFWSVQGAGLGAAGRPPKAGTRAAPVSAALPPGLRPPAPCAILFLCTRGSVSLSRCQVAQFDRLMQGKAPFVLNLHKI